MIGYTNIRTAQGDPRVDYAYIASSTESKDYDPEYNKLPMWDQLGKILDSQDNPFPRDDVLCDDEVRVSGITPKDCIDIRNLTLQFEKTEVRLEFLKRLQMSKNLKEVLDYVRSQ
jgi:hypothetical protein